MTVFSQRSGLVSHYVSIAELINHCNSSSFPFFLGGKKKGDHPTSQGLICIIRPTISLINNNYHRLEDLFASLLFPVLLLLQRDKTRQETLTLSIFLSKRSDLFPIFISGTDLQIVWFSFSCSSGHCPPSVRVPLDRRENAPFRKGPCIIVIRCNHRYLSV